MPRIRAKTVGKRQAAYEDWTDAAKAISEHAGRLAPPLKKNAGWASRGRRGQKARAARVMRSRQNAVWAEQDAEREMHGGAADEHFFAGMDDVGGK